MQFSHARRLSILATACIALAALVKARFAAREAKFARVRVFFANTRASASVVVGAVTGFFAGRATATPDRRRRDECTIGGARAPLAIVLRSEAEPTEVGVRAGAEA